jgi:hypothetical protein
MPGVPGPKRAGLHRARVGPGGLFGHLYVHVHYLAQFVSRYSSERCANLGALHARARTER